MVTPVASRRLGRSPNMAWKLSLKCDGLANPASAAASVSPRRAGE